MVTLLIFTESGFESRFSSPMFSVTVIPPLASLSSQCILSIFKEPKWEGMPRRMKDGGDGNFFSSLGLWALPTYDFQATRPWVESLLLCVPMWWGWVLFQRKGLEKLWGSSQCELSGVLKNVWPPESRVGSWWGWNNVQHKRDSKRFHHLLNK